VRSLEDVPVLQGIIQALKMRSLWMCSGIWRRAPQKQLSSVKTPHLREQNHSFRAFAMSNVSQ
jgi:hypothetical protein